MSDNFSVQYRGQRQDLHAWYVYPIAYTAVSDRNPSPKIEVFEVGFNRSYPRWSCNCTPERFQTVRSPICPHAEAVFRDITSKPGPWERDQILMGVAWDVIREMQYEETELRKKRSKSVEFYISSITKADLDKRIAESFFKDLVVSFDKATTAMNDYSTVYSWDDANNKPTSTPGSGWMSAKADDPIDKQKHEEPKKPKKPKSRFSEIDL